MPKECYVGVISPNYENLNEELTDVEAMGCGFIVSEVWPSIDNAEPMADVALRSKDWFSRVVIKIDVKDLFEGNDYSFKKIRDRFDYVSHLAAHSVYFELPLKRSQLIFLAQVINSKLSEWPVPRIHFEVPAKLSSEASVNSEFKDSWSYWNFFRSLIRTPAQTLTVALRIEDLPEEDEQHRWRAEKIKIIVFPMESFILNKAGCPVLSKSIQVFMQGIFDANKVHVSIAVKGGAKLPGLQLYVQYLNHLIKHVLVPNQDHEFDSTRDLLQVPLQPLKDNLHSGTYEVFERDPIKYEEYKKAILAAIRDKPGNDKLVIMVVGAGRGPLVEASILGAETAQRQCSIVIVEKNPHAIITLKYYMATKWQDRPYVSISLHHGDMREFKGTELADIVVSELLGSFSDNELSPECLDGVYLAVKPDAVSIPTSYTSYLRPIMSRELFEKAQGSQDWNEKKNQFASMETGYVVFMKNFYSPVEPKELFTFEHTKLDLPPSSRNNSRFEELTFETDIDYVCHGFAGYFETTLYKDIRLSTNPLTHSQGMFSWFPIYFPILNPILIPGKSPLKVCFWRQSDGHRVWYEWCLTHPTVTEIHNSAGRSSYISLH